MSSVSKNNKFAFTLWNVHIISYDVGIDRWKDEVIVK